MLYDLHMHSCLSPCAEDDMTPANIAGLAKLAGAELIAVTDHNAADNLPAVQCCCNAYGLRLLPVWRWVRQCGLPKGNGQSGRAAVPALSGHEKTAAPTGAAAPCFVVFSMQLAFLEAFGVYTPL